MSARRVATLLFVLLALDLAGIVVTGRRSLLGLGAPVSMAGFNVRLLALGAALVARFRLLAPPGRRLGGAHLLLGALLLPVLAQFQWAGGRVNGDGIMYYVFTRSLLKDGDVDLANEYTHYGLIDRGDLAVPTRTGLRRSIFSIGPSLLTAPFFLLGEGVARLEGRFGTAADLSGYGPAHRNAVALGSLLLGFGAVLLVHETLRRHFAPPTALGAALLLWGASFLPWYMVQQPTMSHAPSAFISALAVWLWDRGRPDRGPAGFLGLGLVLGLAMCVRWQNGLLLLLPAAEVATRLVKEERARPRVLGGALLLGAGVLAGAFPQMAVWKALYDMWLLPYPPHGRDFVRLDHPFVLQTLFSSRHGLLSWTPVFWAGFLGLVPLLRRRPALGAVLGVPVVLMTYVNMCSGDWWAGGSFSNRRFDSLLPLFAFGFAASIDAVREAVRRRPGAVCAALVAGAVCWNLSVTGMRRAPGPPPSRFSDLVGEASRTFARRWGSPTTWPASWLFAWQHHRPPGQYDVVVGRYLFYRQNNLGGRIDIGQPGDEAMLGEGFGQAGMDGKVAFRRLEGRARLFAPLDVPETLQVWVRARAAPAAVLDVEVNGRPAGSLTVGAQWDTSGLSVPAASWRRELNALVLVPSAPVWVDQVMFTRSAPAARDR